MNSNDRNHHRTTDRILDIVELIAEQPNQLTLSDISSHLNIPKSSLSPILYTLMEFGVVRFNEMKKYIGGISYKTLSSTLKELEADQLVHREEYPQIPPKVEYSLTQRGKSLIPILDGMCEWGDKNRL